MIVKYSMGIQKLYNPYCESINLTNFTVTQNISDRQGFVVTFTIRLLNKSFFGDNSSTKGLTNPQHTL